MVYGVESMVMLVVTGVLVIIAHVHGFGEQPLAKIDIYKTILALKESASVYASPLLGLKGEDAEWVTVDVVNPEPSADDWVGGTPAYKAHAAMGS
ncbi:unnamed protein product [Dovyalis caffra]|uniref:Uncharacterized protein n=1 Tax=Dovyalis caffra TaxID=77055 RepID=A0AAV1RLE0_9ROSI|nr:unnamed protein product [Dovyalis caffra]